MATTARRSVATWTTATIGRLELGELVSELRYLNARRGGGTRVERLPIQRATVDALPDDLDAIIACSDLQGIVPGRDGEATLLGVAGAELLDELALAQPGRTGVVLAGDLYSVPEANKRGGHGSVADVWAAFAERFAWVVGVAGNHDDVSEVTHGHVLDGDAIELDGWRIGGVGLIAGNPDKRGRRSEDDQLARIDRVLGRRAGRQRRDPHDDRARRRAADDLRARPLG